MKHLFIDNTKANMVFFSLHVSPQHFQSYDPFVQIKMLCHLITMGCLPCLWTPNIFTIIQILKMMVL